MKKKYFAAALLNYKSISAYAGFYERAAVSAAVNSSGFYGPKGFDAMYYCKKVLAFKEKKAVLTLLSGTILSLIKKLPYRYKRILELKIVEKTGAEETALKLGLSARTLPRMFAAAVERFCGLATERKDIFTAAYHGT